MGTTKSRMGGCADAVSGIRDLAITGFVAALAVKFFAIPIVEPFSRVMSPLWPERLKPYYDPAHDHVASLMAMSAAGGYLFMAVGVCSVLDQFPSLTAPYKVQGHKAFFTANQWLQAVAVSAVNMLGFSWFATIPAWQIQKSGVLRGWTPLATMQDPLHLPAELANLLVHVLVIEVWFFATHWALHQRPLYRLIHKFHHRFKAPTAVACMYANPIEFCVGNVGGVVLGPALTNCHPVAAGFWMAFSLVSVSMSHSGYKCLGADKHDQHHEHFDYNFGVVGTMDVLCGTQYKGSDREKANLAKIKAN